MGSIFGRLAAVIGASVLVGACSSGDSPDTQVEYAVQGVYTAALSADARYAAVGSIQHGGSLWNSVQHERLYNWNHKEGSYTDLVATAFSPDGEYAVTAGQQTLVLWETSTGKPHWFWNSPAAVLDIALSPEGSYALLGLIDHTAVYFDIKNGGLKQTLHHQGRVRAVDLSDDGNLGLTGSDNNLAKLWNMQNGELLQTVEHENSVNTVALSPSGRYAFSASQLDRAFIWDTQSGNILHTLSGDEGFLAKRLSYTAAVFSPNSDQLLTGNTGGLVQLWDVREGKELRRWQVFLRDKFRPTSATVFALAFSNRGYTAVAANGFINQLK
ncbi:WD40 repeat domain-containing protein [Motiliproteus sp. MSK22-1]|uniref:WD40 repeat domain-containing protein n=1 Tax=Motiliproteus sp. MSK22-1 TaxID=1897630 RepID=UPI0009786306|nr:hypothetical protein [Motiliproteus sp. MSK22-1]OMH39670.1 hypothetical protein BGP75_02215 [Motiliproteus sp. MSK22-1]